MMVKIMVMIVVNFLPANFHAGRAKKRLEAQAAWREEVPPCHPRLCLLGCFGFDYNEHFLGAGS